MTNRESRRKKVFDTSVLVFPNLFTTGNLFCGFYSIICSLRGDFYLAAYFILVAGLFDLVDGRVARLVKSVSEFGKEYDSLADLVSFGVAPALMAYLCNLSFIPRVGWLVSFLFVACGALRLARFNVISELKDPRFFVGLPIPIAAATVATGYLFVKETGIDVRSNYIFVVMVPILSFLMVSAVNYKSYKKAQETVKKVFFTNMIMFLLLLVVVAVHPDLVLFMLAVIYIVYGFLMDVYNRIRLMLTNKKTKFAARLRDKDGVEL
jgi:CDP-diacylglycerol---serine O-phosphatidyltransferase